MKYKIFSILTCMFLFSCSSDGSDEATGNNNENPSDGNALLVSEISHSDGEISDYSYKSKFFYDGYKIERIENESYYNGALSSTSSVVFVYINNLISRIDEYDSYNNNSFTRTELIYDSQGRLIGNSESCYSNGQLVQDACDYTLDFTYNSNGIISFVQDDSEISNGSIQLDNNNNIISINSTTGSDSYTAEYEYDNYNSPFKNIVGNLPLLFFPQYINYLELELASFTNNCTKITYESEYGSESINFAYDYNEDGYPRNIIVTYSDDDYEEFITLKY